MENAVFKLNYGKNWIVVLLAIAVLAVASLPVVSAVVEYGLGMVSETVNGRNSTGPYFLAYTNVNEQSFEVTVDGAMLKQGKDYRTDFSKGILTFNRILTTNTIAKVTYRIVPGKSVKTAGVLKVPLEIELLDNDYGRVRLIGNYSQSAAENQEAGTVIGLGSENRIGSANISSMLLTGRPEAGPEKPGNNGWNDKSLYKIAVNSSSDDLKVTGNLLRVGHSFINPAQYGVTAGREADNLNISYKYGKLLDFAAVYQKLNESLANTEHIINQQNLTMRPNEKMVVAMAHSENTKTEGGSTQSIENTGIKIDHKIGQSAHAALSRNEVVTNTDGTEKSETTTQLTASGGNKVVQVSGSAVQKEFNDKDDQTNLSLNANVKASEKVGVKVGASTSNDDTDLYVKTDVKASDNVKIGAGLASSKNDIVGDQVVKNLDISLKEGNLLKVDAGASLTNSTLLGETFEHKVAVAANPMNRLQVAGYYGGKESEYEMLSQRMLSVTAQPVDYASIGASYTLNEINDVDNIVKAGNLELRPFTNAKFAVGYRYVENGGAVTTVTDYSTSASPFRFLSLSGNLRQRELMSGHLDSQNLNIRMSPTGLFSLEGSYIYNPENEEGQVLTERNTGLGIRSNFGRWGIYGGYKHKENYLVDVMSEERSLSVNYRLDGYSSLSAGVIQSMLANGSLAGDATYTMGFQRKVGSAFELQLTGRYTKYLQDAGLFKDKASAEASLAIEF